MQLIEVTDKKTGRQFLDIARKLYRNDPNFICPLDEDINKIFDPGKNAFFKDGKAIRWFLKDDDGTFIGRIAAFYNERKAFRYKQPTGGAGFFECINNQQAANFLFDAAKDWLEQQGMEAMDAPVNFGENDNFWGLLVEGFTPPAYGMPYNFPYYQQLFENYGFAPYFTQITKHLDLTVPFPERFWRIAEWVSKRPGFSFRHFNYKDADKFIHDLKEVYDQAWVHHEHFIPLDLEVVKRELESARPILEEDFIWFVYFEDKPVAFFIMFPDANMIFRHFNGKLTPWNKLRFLYYKKTKEITRIRQTMMGVIPKFHGQGLESAIFSQLKEPVKVKRPHITEMELSWVGDFNPKMMAIQEAVNAKPGKIHITYRKLFRETDETQHAQKIPLGKD
jgi:GNAT superfamily N-acetyltransferase